MSRPVEFNGDDAVTWEKAITFQDWVIKQVLARQTNSPEFQAVLRFHGREKIEKIWLAHVEKQKAAGGGAAKA